MNIILILLNYFSLSFQLVPTYIFCDDHLEKIYEYDRSTLSYKQLTYIDKRNLCYDPDYLDLDVEPGAFIKFDCLNTGGPSLGGGCFLINNKCRCYDFNINGKSINNKKDPWLFTVRFNNGITCNHNAKYLEQEEEGIHVYYYNVPLDVSGITCNPKTITAPINIERSLKFSEFIKSSFNFKNLNIGVITNYKYFTYKSLPISEYEQFNIYTDLKYFSNQTSKIKIEFRNYGVVINNIKDCSLNIRFCYDSCLDCNDIEPIETSQQCLKCKDGFYFIENTNNCMTKAQMKNSNYSHYYFDDNKTLFRQCPNECSTCDNETYCTNCTEGYHFIYKEAGKCISEPTKEDLLYLDNKTNTYIKCPEETEKVENNTCIIKGKVQQFTKENNNIIIIILIIVILIIIIALFFFIKRCTSKKKIENELPNTLENNASDNKLLNIFI